MAVTHQMHHPDQWKKRLQMAAVPVRSELVDPSLKSKQGITAPNLANEYKNQPAIDVLTGR
jgi:hypothetical protein